MNLRICQQLICSAFASSAPLNAFKLAEKMIKQTEAFSSAERIGVYRQNISGAQERVLHMVFPVCMQILGETCFNNLARDYIWSVDSEQSDLNLFGDKFPDWLEKQISLHSTLRDYQYMADLARFEWAWHQTLFARDDTPFNTCHLNDVVNDYGEKITPQLSHSLTLFSSAWPIYDIWLSHKEGLPEKEYIIGEPQYHLIHRQHEVDIHQVNTTTFIFLQLCQQQKTLEQIAYKMGNMAPLCFAQMHIFIQNGWITGFQPQTHKDLTSPNV